MDNEHIRDVANQYIAHLCTLPNSMPSRRANTGCKSISKQERVRHLMWMLEEIIRMPNDRFEKANRWLGFVQGSMWSLGIRSVDEMRDDNRSRVS